MSEGQVNKIKEGIATDVLLYLEHRFGKIDENRKEERHYQDGINSKLFRKLDEISKVTNENLTVALNQNSRIFKLEAKHENCPGIEALANVKVKDAVDLKEDELTSDKRWVIGKTLKDWSITLAAITAIITGVVLISKHIVL